MADNDTTHFGFLKIPTRDKARRVAEVFTSVTGRYDVMNDVMSLGMHRVMKHIAVEATAARANHRILDLAAGTGDLSILLNRHVGNNGQVVMCDINASMLAAGRDRLLDKGIVIDCVQADAEALPFPDDAFDCITMAFGLRNVTDKNAALTSMCRVLRPGGRVVILEFSKPKHELVGRAYDAWRGLWPGIGKALAGDADSYRYLVESIDMHPGQDELAAMMTAAGFERVRYDNLLDGVAALHVGRVPRKPGTDSNDP